MNWPEVKEVTKKRETSWGEENEDECTGGWDTKNTKKRTKTMPGGDGEYDIDEEYWKNEDQDASRPSSEVGSEDSVDGEIEEDDEEADGDEEDHPSMREPAPGKGESLDTLSPSDKARFLAADTRRRDDTRVLLTAFTRLVSLKADLQKCQQKLDEAQGIYDNIKHVAVKNATSDADDLLLEPSPWNNHYKQLVKFFEREGHSNFKRTITPSDVVGMSESDAKEMYDLSWWTCRQRKFKRRGELEEFKIQLLDRVKFNWDPHSGPGPEKWLKNYGLLKEFKQKHGHVRVPIDADDKLGSWLKTQMNQYRNTQEGKLPALSSERIQLLEDIGVDWGKRRWTTPWDERFNTLLDFRRRFGHPNVPWQWKENVALAQWVNSQRKKYKDLTEGRRNNLSEEQISRLNSIGFQWSTEGKGRYSNEHASKMPAAQLYIPGVRVPTLLPTGMVPVLAMADPASMNNVMLQNFVPAMPAMPVRLGPAEYANYLSMMTKGMMGNMGNQDVAMYPPNQIHLPNPRELAELAYAYHHQINQANPHVGGDKPLS